MDGDYTVGGLAVPETIDLLHQLLEEVRLDHPEVAEGDLSLFETAIVEIAGNVVQHAGAGGTTLYEFTLRVEPHRLVGELSYAGAEVPRVSGDNGLPDASAESGRGLYLAHAVLDDLAYTFGDGENTWRMVRSRRDAVAGP